MFSIDGLKDTNHIYRRGCNWEKIMRNAKMWIDAGGEAEWAMIDFPYNKHQRKEAEQMAKDMGFQDFRVRERTSPDPEFDNWIESKQHDPVLQKMINLEHLPELQEQKIEYHELQKEWKGQKVKPACTFLDADGHDHWPNFHVNVEGTLWPCCFTSNLPYMQEYEREIWKDMDKKYSVKYGPNWNNLDYRTLDEILETDWFKKDLQASWTSDDETGLLVCKRNCCDKGYVWEDDLGKKLATNNWD